MAVIATAAMLANMTPASAAGSGVSQGESSISETGSGLPVCLGAKSGMSITLYNTGTFTAGTQTFQGKTKMVFQAGTGTAFYFNPAGIFSDSDCRFPYVVPGSITVTTEPDPGNIGTVSCTGNGGYRRVGNDYVVTNATHANPLNNTCTVNGATANSILEFSGNQNPCFAGAPFDPCQVPNTEMVGVYTQSP